MGAQLDRLKTALADRYAIAEEIGSGPLTPDPCHVPPPYVVPEAIWA